MNKRHRFSFAIAVLILATALAAGSGCSVSYGLSDKAAIPDSVKTVRVNFIENRAPYVNPRLSPVLTESFRQKIIRQTRLTVITQETAHWDINCTITDYSVSTSSVTSTNGRSQGSINRLSVGVHITINKQIDKRVVEYDISRQFDYDANLSLQDAERRLFDEIIRNLSDEIFNRLFSEW